MKKRTFISALLRSRIMVVVLIILTIVSALRLTNEISRRSKINAEITRLQQEIETLKNEQKGLSDIANYFESDYYLEEQARKQLSLVKPGETIVVVEDDSKSTISSASVESNIVHWMEYFFNS